jgi:hypothetical protein
VEVGGRGHFLGVKGVWWVYAVWKGEGARVVLEWRWTKRQV